MATTRERLHELLDELTDNQVETVLGFTEAVRKGRAEVSTCDPTGANPMSQAPIATPDHRRT
jgi:hypothetical protein